jgi:hypothetical protein
MAKRVEEEVEMTPAEMRRAAHEAKMAEVAAVEDSRDEFRKYFIGLKKKLDLAPELENVIWIHLRAIGMDKKDQFNDGIKHFGYKI